MIAEMTLGGIGGGGGGMEAMKVRQEFPDTALWGHISAPARQARRT